MRAERVHVFALYLVARKGEKKPAQALLPRETINNRGSSGAICSTLLPAIPAIKARFSLQSVYGASKVCSPHIATATFQMLRNFLFIVFGALGISILLAVVLLLSGQMTITWQTKLTFSAKGAHWQGRDIKTIENGGKYAMTMLAIPQRGSSTQQRFMIDDELLLSLCEGVLEQMPILPIKAHKPEDLYRLGFQFILDDDGSLSDQLPVAVKDGNCATTLFDGLYRWNYPGKLTGWALMRLNKAEGGPNSGRITIELVRIANDGASLQEFDHLAACNAVFRDMPASVRSAIATPEQVAIKATSRKGISSVYTGISRTETFNVDGDRCSP